MVALSYYLEVRQHFHTEQYTSLGNFVASTTNYSSRIDFVRVWESAVGNSAKKSQLKLQKHLICWLESIPQSVPPSPSSLCNLPQCCQSPDTAAESLFIYILKFSSINTALNNPKTPYASNERMGGREVGRECYVVLGIPNSLSEQLHNENNPRSQESQYREKSTALADVPSASLRSSSPLHNLVERH